MKKIIPISIVIAGIGLLYPLQRWIDAGSAHRASQDDTLYLTSGPAIKRMSVGLDAIVADIYWIRTVQYFGRKLLESGAPISAASAGTVRLDQLAPYLNIIVSLDPHHISAYRFGALFLPDQDLPAAIKLVEQGIENNPDEWRLYQDLGYIYWHSGDYEKAAETYDRGSQVSGALWWMHDLAGLMRIKGGSREAARQIYQSYLGSDDQYVRQQAVDRLRQLEALDEIDALNAILVRYRAQFGSCPPSLRVLATYLNANGFALNKEMVPVDPAGVAYELSSDTCTVQLALSSPIPR